MLANLFIIIPCHSSLFSIYLISILGTPRPSLKQLCELRGSADSERQVRAAAVVTVAVPPRPNAEGGGRASASVPLRDRRRAPRPASRTRRGGVVHRSTDSTAVARRVLVHVYVHVRGLARSTLEAAPPRARLIRPIGGAPSDLSLRPRRRPRRHRREAAARTGTGTSRLRQRGLVSRRRSVHRPRRCENSRAIEPRLRATDALNSRKQMRNWKRRRTPQDAAGRRSPVTASSYSTAPPRPSASANMYECTRAVALTTRT